MGGNCLKVAKTRRFEAEEYRMVVQEIAEIFDYETEWAVDLIPSYRTKQSFGDADFLVFWDSHTTQPVSVVQQLFDPTEIVKNGQVISFDYKELQVDLIYAPFDERSFAYNYYAWNDMGNFIGRTARRLGFKFGHNGLWHRLYDQDDDTHLFKEILVTRDFATALEFLGFDSKRFAQGFDTCEQIFEFAVSSQWVDVKQFLLANRPSESRKRDRTRKMYTELLAWIMKNNPQLNENDACVLADKAMHLERAFVMFPEFAKDYAKANSDLLTLKAFKANFNGDNYSKWFGIEGPALGSLMRKHKEYFEKNNLTQWVSTLSVPSFKTVALTLEEHEFNDQQ